MTTTSSTLLSMLAEPLLAGGLLLGYNAFLGSGVNTASLMDATYLAASDWISNTLTTLFFTPSSTLSTIFGTQANATYIESNFIVPILTSLLYTYAYDNYYKSQFNVVTNRTTNYSYIVSFAASFISSLYSGSIYNLLTTSL